MFKKLIISMCLIVATIHAMELNSEYFKDNNSWSELEPQSDHEWLSEKITLFSDYLNSNEYCSEEEKECSDRLRNLITQIGTMMNQDITAKIIILNLYNEIRSMRENLEKLPKQKVEQLQ